MKRPVITLLFVAGLFLSAAPFSRRPDVMELLRTGQLRFIGSGMPDGVSDSTDVVRLFGPDYQRSSSWVHASMRGGGSINQSTIHFRHKRQGVKLTLNSYGYLSSIVLTKPYLYPIVDGLRMGRVTYQELSQRYFPGDHDCTSINVTTNQRGKRVLESGLGMPDMSYCRGWFICQRNIQSRYGSFNNEPFYHPVLEPLIRESPLTEVYLWRPRSYDYRK